VVIPNCNVASGHPSLTMTIQYQFCTIISKGKNQLPSIASELGTCPGRRSYNCHMKKAELTKNVRKNSPEYFRVLIDHSDEGD
jgi:hypothetical protein